MRRLLVSAAIFGLSVVGFDLLIAGAARGTVLADRVVDIEHPTTLLTKLDRLRAAPAPKIVLLGDSLVYGGTLEVHGDSQWRDHHLAVQLADELERRMDQRPFVMNLGMNGALPADLEHVVPLVTACGVDCVVLDVHLRPFSTDFSPPDRQMSRPWLRELAVMENQRVRWQPPGGVGLQASAWLADYSAIWRNRMLAQESLITARRPRLRKTSELADTDAEIQALIKLAQLKSRLKSLDLGPEAPQVAALQRTLTWMSRREQRHVVFYAKENPGLLPDVMDSNEYTARYGDVLRLVGESQGPTGTFVGPIPELTSEHFLDFTHVNSEGYRLLARRLAQEIDRPTRP